MKLNPNAVVPTLVDDGVVIIESTVINEYLDDAYSSPPLRPADAVARARMRLWTKQLDEGVHAATSVLSSCMAFRYQKLARGEEELRKFHEQMPDPKKRERSGTDARTSPHGMNGCASGRRTSKPSAIGSTLLI